MAENVCPTFTALSRTVVRHTKASGEVTLARVHHLEQMRMMGWDIPFYKDCVSPFHSISDVELSSLAGNMWSAFTYLAIEVALAGCIPWAEAMDVDAKTDESSKSKSENDDEDEGSGYDSESSPSQPGDARRRGQDWMPAGATNKGNVVCTYEYVSNTQGAYSDPEEG